jgi:alanine racemase
MARNTVAQIDLSALRHNLGVVRSLAPSSQIVSVIKADAYGHGIQRVARALADTDVFAVATPGEAQAVRAGGWQGRLLLLEGFANAEAFELARALQLELVVHQRSQLELLRQRGCGARQRIWLKLDTGMHRLGFPAAEALDVLSELERIECAAPPVVMTHFACADDPGNPMTARQIEVFEQALAGWPGDRSLANSAAIINFPASCQAYVRPGILLYGISPCPGVSAQDLGLRPAMTLSCELIAVNACQAGDRVGYGGCFECPEPMRIGVAAIGYGDGYPRHLPNGTPVLVNGRPASLAGRVSMDLITVDLRGIDDAAEGDAVTLWGSGLPVEDVAARAQAIPYELVCGVTGRVERVEA